jgi:Zn-dependent peptidase ImmA (M78 family)
MFVNKESNMPSSFGERLRSARVMAGLSMDALVERMRHLVTKQAISKYEKDQMSPDSSVLVALSQALGVKTDYFFSQYEISLESINFRKKASLGAKAVESLKARIKDTIERYAELESFFPAAGPFINPLADTSISSLESIQEAARELRTAWGLGSEAPVISVVDLLEDHSVRMIEIDGGEGFDGQSGWGGGFPFIVLNSAAPSDRKRLTALHEFAHLTLRFAASVPGPEREKLCNSFGASFLLPGDVLKKELGERRLDVSFFELDRIKRLCGISMQAVMYRARQEGIISEHVHEAFSRQVSAKGWRKHEPNEYPIPEHPQRFEQLLHRALSEELLSISKAAYLANQSIEEIRRQRLLEDDPPHP